MHLHTVRGVEGATTLGALQRLGHPNRGLIFAAAVVTEPTRSLLALVLILITVPLETGITEIAMTVDKRYH